MKRENVMRDVLGEKIIMNLLSRNAIITATLWLLTACASAPVAAPTLLPSSTQAEPTSTWTLTPSATLSPTPAETAILQVAASSPTASPSPENTLTPSPTLSSLEFLLPSPTSTTTAEAAWRPPAYPVPWALHPYDHFYFSRPIASQDIKLPLSNYRYGNVFFGEHVHTGMDIPSDMRKPVLAAGDGKVIWSGYGLYRGGVRLDDPYGISVVIKHSFGYRGEPLFTVYAHLDEAIVQEGDLVRAGDQVGMVGDTGHTTGPHLHFEVRVGENDYFATRNPALWLAPPQGWGVLVGRIESGYGRELENQAVYVHSNIDLEAEEDENEFWIVNTYTKENITPDPYYQENLVLPDLPAGYYRVSIPYAGIMFSEVIEIKPGEVTYFTFQGWDGIEVVDPPSPEILFTPSP